MNTWCRTRHRRKQADGTRERQVWIFRAQHRARRRWRIVLEDHGRGTCRAQGLLVFGIGEERDVPRFGGLNARDPADLDVAVTFQPAVEPLCEFAQFHLSRDCTRTAPATRRMSSWQKPAERPPPSSIMPNIAYRLARRIAVSVVGFTVLAIGIAMIALPGPAFIVIPAGLGILGLEFAWARRWLQKVREKAEAVAKTVTGSGDSTRRKSS